MNTDKLKFLKLGGQYKVKSFARLMEECGFCSDHFCFNCPIFFINPKYKCGNGCGYSLCGNPVPLSEALKYYSIIFEKQNLRALIVRRRGYYKYERRI